MGSQKEPEQAPVKSTSVIESENPAPFEETEPAIAPSAEELPPQHPDINQTPLQSARPVEPVKPIANDPLEWSTLAFTLKLDAIARQVVLNTVVLSFQEQQLKLAYLPELEIMLKPEIEKQIKQAIEDKLGVSLKLEFSSVTSLQMETPHQAEVRRQEQHRQDAIQQIRQDPTVDQLNRVFGAQLIEQSVRKLSEK